MNTECLIQLDDGSNPLKGRHWYCDAMAVNFKEQTVYLCEITYSVTMQALLGRLQAWQNNWGDLTAAVLRDAGISKDWKIQPWLFIPEVHHADFVKKFATQKPKPGVTWDMPAPRVTYLESVVPWKYKNTWDRKIDV